MKSKQGLLRSFVRPPVLSFVGGGGGRSNFLEEGWMKERGKREEKWGESWRGGEGRGGRVISISI